jgi:PAS domain S-box-containing protein
MSPWFALSWERIRYWLRASTFSPEWLTSPWNHPVVGYLFAFLLPMGSIILTLLLRSIFLTFALPGLLSILVISVVALIWGTGPGLFATLWGTILLNFIILSPQSNWSLDTFQQIFETCFFLVIGVTISLVVSRTELARAEAVTARRELEAAHVALHKSQVYSRRLFDSNLIGILLADQECIYEANEAFLHIVGYDREDLEFQRIRWREMTPPDYAPLDEYAIKELVERGECTPFEKEYIRKDGSRVPIFIGAALMERDPLRWVCFVLDLTERKRLEKALAERVSEVEAIFEAMADGVYVYDTQGSVIRTNAAAQAFNPFTRQSDYLARPFSERISSFLPRDENGKPFEISNLPVTRVLQGETLTGLHTADIILRQQNRTDVFLNVSGSPVRDDKGQIREAVIVTRDVTERRRLEQRTREALDAMLAMIQLIGQGFEDTDDTESKTRELTELTTQKVAQRMAELTRSFLGCQRLSISIAEPKTEILRPVAVVGLTPEQEHQWWAEQQQENRIVDSPDQTFVQRLQANEVVLFDMTQQPWDSYPNPLGLRTILIAPMKIRDRLVGLVSLDYGGAEHLYTSEELALAGAVANLIATVIERDRLLRQRAEMRANELALRISNQQMAELITLAHDAIIVRTPARTIISWNKGAERLYGWTEQEAVGQISHELLQTSFPHSREVTDNLLALYGQWEGQVTHTCQDGTQVIVESRQVLVRDDSGQPTAILEINRDITERERMQQEREEARANELALREANRRMDDFLGIISHELRTPLTTIKGNVQLARLRLRSSLREVPADRDVLRSMLEEIPMMLERAERQVNVENRLVSDLLDISRLESDVFEMRLVECDLAAIARETVEDQRSTIPTRPIHLDLAEEETAPIIADPERIGQVLSNYLTNALKYSSVGCPIDVQLKKEDTMVRISVRDEGPGLTPTEQERIWERFYKIEGIRRQRGSSVGLGLGLYICRAIVEQHQGEVGVESTKGVGSTFWFTLPLADPDEQEAV